MHFWHSGIKRSRLPGRWIRLYTLAGTDTPTWGVKRWCVEFAREQGCVAVFHDTRRQALRVERDSLFNEIFNATLT
jgi:hypothetical protein